MGLGTIIPSGDDLNNYEQPGVYSSMSNDITSTLTNIPPGLTGGFRLEVSYRTSVNYETQILYQNGEAPRMYIRNKNSGVWKDWVKNTTNADLDTKTLNITAATGVTLSSPYAYRTGNIVTFGFGAKLPTTISTSGWMPIAAIPAGNSMKNIVGEALIYSALGESPIVRDFLAVGNEFRIYLSASDAGKSVKLWGAAPIN